MIIGGTKPVLNVAIAVVEEFVYIECLMDGGPNGIAKADIVVLELIGAVLGVFEDALKVTGAEMLLIGAGLLLVEAIGAGGSNAVGVLPS